jgi:DNA-binding NarL/FixJ family response regulator
MIRIVLVDDQELVRTGLRALAEHDGDIVVAGEAANGAAGLHKVAECLPDVVLMDIRMPVMDGLVATARIMDDPALTGVSVLILTTFDEDENVFDATRLGAAGYLLKDISPGELRHAIRVVAGGTRCSRRPSPARSCGPWRRAGSDLPTPSRSRP